MQALLFFVQLLSRFVMALHDAEDKQVLDVLAALEKDPWSVKLPFPDEAAKNKANAEWEDRCNSDNLAMKDLLRQQRMHNFVAVRKCEVHARKNFSDNMKMPEKTQKQKAKLQQKLEKDMVKLEKLLGQVETLRESHRQKSTVALRKLMRMQLQWLVGKIKQAKARHEQDLLAIRSSFNKEFYFFQELKKDITKKLRPKKRKQRSSSSSSIHQKTPKQVASHGYDASVVVYPGCNDGILHNPLPAPASFRPPANDYSDHHCSACGW